MTFARRTWRRMLVAPVLVLVSVVAPAVVAAPAQAATDWNLPEMTIYKLYNPHWDDTMWSVDPNEAGFLGFAPTGETLRVWRPRDGQAVDPAPAGLSTLWRIMVGSKHALTVGTVNYGGNVTFEFPFGYVAYSKSDAQANSARPCPGESRFLQQLQNVYPGSVPRGFSYQSVPLSSPTGPPRPGPYTRVESLGFGAC